MTGFVTEDGKQVDCSIHRADIEGWSVYIQAGAKRFHHKRFHRESSASLHADALKAMIGARYYFTL